MKTPRRFTLIHTCHGGLASIEFALIAPIVLWLTMALFELGVVTLMNVVMQGGLDRASRVGMAYIPNTYRPPNSPYGNTNLNKLFAVLDAFEHEVGGFFPPHTVKIDPKDCGDRTTTFLGADGSMACYEATYDYEFATPFLKQFFPDPYTIRAVTVVRNENVI